MSTVLVTGSSGGLGRSLVNELTERNYQVIASARNINDIENLAVFKKIVLDICNEENIIALEKEKEDIDILINNAAYNVAGPLRPFPLKKYKRKLKPI